MLNTFYLFLAPTLFIIGFLTFKYLRHKEEILAISEGETSLSEDGSLEKVENNLEVARIKMVEFLEYSKEKVLQEVKINLHRLLHLFVIFFKFISDLSDAMYVFSRDFFLKTATKEKNSVSTFWHHLKEYKKEKEQEKEGS
jgi:hypothetical protein